MTFELGMTNSAQSIPTLVSRLAIAAIASRTLAAVMV